MKVATVGRRRNQPAEGFILLLIVLTLMAISGVIVLNKLGQAKNSSQRQTEQAQASNDVLVAAKAALLGYVAQNIDGGSGYRLGNLPPPDILNGAGTSIQYDGKSDTTKCLSSGINGLPGVSAGTTSRANTLRCLGKFPWRTFSLDVGNPDTNDPQGQVPWMAISSNLNYWDNCLATLNSDTVNWTVSAGTSCPATANTLPYAWMRVVDQYGNTLSNRVAAVLIMPGPPIVTGGRVQDRSLTSTRFPGYPVDFLDKISVPLGCVASCTATFDNADLTNNFIQIPPGTHYPASAENAALAGQPLAFNDVLIYITIDELMIYIEGRVTSEMAIAVRNAKTKTTTYPWAATFVTPSSTAAFTSTPGKLVGLFPFFPDKITGPTPPGGYPAFPTSLDWTLGGLSNPSPRTCAQVQNGPSRWIDTRKNIDKSVAQSGSLAQATTSCTWKGPNEVSCDGTITQPGLIDSYDSFTSLANCNSNSGGSGTNYTRNRVITIAIGATCNAAPTVTYSGATASQFERWKWICSSVNSGTTFTVNVTDTFITTPSATGTFTFNGSGQSVTVSNMSYQPLMPYWFYANEWYKLAFYAVPRSIAPGSSSDCGSATALTVGANAVNYPLVQIAGKNLTLNTRPSGLRSDYFEGANVASNTNCIFEDTNKTITSTYNDQARVVVP